MFISALQLLLYMPDFTCTISSGLPLCAPQFSFSIIEDSPTTKDFVASVREFLKLLSYMAIDLGWSTELMDSEIYEEKNLVDTFHHNNVYKVNYLGYCKVGHSGKNYCTLNGDSGMDVLEILVRDVGIQLGKLSTAHVNNTKILSDSLVLTYHLTVSSLKSFLKNDRHRDNALTNILFGLPISPQPDSDSFVQDNDNLVQHKTASYGKGVGIAHTLSLYNMWFFYLHIVEFISSFLCTSSVGGLGLVLLWGKKHNYMPDLMKTFTCILNIISAITFLAHIIYILSLKLLEKDPDGFAQNDNNWDLLRVKLGVGFFLLWFRVFLQLIQLPLVWFVANRYRAETNKKLASNIKKDSKP